MPGTTGPHSYRDFIDPDAPMYISDWGILEALDERDHASPREIAEQRRRENVIRLQMRDLLRIGAIRTKSQDTYCLTTKGDNIRRGSVNVPDKNGLFAIGSIEPEAFPEDAWRLTDFSNLDGQTVKTINFEMIEDIKQEYGWVRNSPEITRRRINNVPDTDLHRIIREFPTHDPLPEQCAHWLRAFAGLHLFPDANHRTAMNSLSVPYHMLTGQSLPIGAEIERTVLESKLARHLLSSIRYNSLWEYDPLYYVWQRYFRRILCGDGSRRHSPPEHHLRSVLNYARKIR